MRFNLRCHQHDITCSVFVYMQALPVAELPPFRLTRQLRNVLLPHDAAGLLQPAMAAWLDAASEGQQVTHAPACDIITNQKCCSVGGILQVTRSVCICLPGTNVVCFILLARCDPHPPCVSQVLASILQVFLAEPLGEWQRETGPLAQLAMAAASGGDGDDDGQRQAAAVQHLDVADLKVRAVLTSLAYVH